MDDSSYPTLAQVYDEMRCYYPQTHWCVKCGKDLGTAEEKGKRACKRCTLREHMNRVAWEERVRKIHSSYSCTKLNQPQEEEPPSVSVATLSMKKGSIFSAIWWGLTWIWAKITNR